jgi:hypothetical protein
MKAWSVPLLLVTACERSSAVDCPPNATVEVFQIGSGDTAVTRKMCHWDGGSETIETDARGDVVEHMRSRDGELDGPQLLRTPGNPGRRTEMVYRRGVLHGFVRDFEGDKLVHECFYIDGVRDGFCWSLPGKTPSTIGVADVKQYDRGRRTGVWWISHEGKVNHVRVYGDDILLGIDGRSVPLPPTSIDVDGEVIRRSQCPPLLEFNERCHALFEDYQICELEPADRASCRERALSSYRSSRR